MGRVYRSCAPGRGRVAQGGVTALTAARMAHAPGSTKPQIGECVDAARGRIASIARQRPSDKLTCCCCARKRKRACTIGGMSCCRDCSRLIYNRSVVAKAERLTAPDED
jgi:hypothetical protein